MHRALEFHCNFRTVRKIHYINIIAILLMCIGVTMQREEKRPIHNLDQMLLGELYKFHLVYYQVLTHKIPIDRNLTLSYEILQEHSILSFLYTSLQIQLEIVSVHEVQFLLKIFRINKNFIIREFGHTVIICITII